MFFWPGNVQIYCNFSSYDELLKLQDCQNLVKTIVFTMFRQISGFRARKSTWQCLGPEFGHPDHWRWSKTSSRLGKRHPWGLPRLPKSPGRFLWDTKNLFKAAPGAIQGLQSMLRWLLELSNRKKRAIFKTPKASPTSISGSQACAVMSMLHTECQCVTHTIWCHHTKY